MRLPGRRSSMVAKDRLKLLLTSERLSCTPQMMAMLQNDMVHAVNKYFAVKEKNVEIRYLKDSATFLARIPLQKDIEDSSPGISCWR